MTTPNPLDHYGPDGTLDAVGWTHALIDHARAQNEATADDAEDLADEVDVLGAVNATLGAENAALLAENARLRAIVAADISRPGRSVASEAQQVTAKQRSHRIHDHFERKRSYHR